ncbi:4-hydroxy-3-methylbut-2-enyl diphosphate reductase [Candidatus Omnitrophota bacterium]
MILKINLARNAGFCFGVRRALDIALKTADSRRQVYMLGDIVHNEHVVKTIERAGIRKINRLFPGKGKTLLVRAHGISTDTIREAKRLKFRVIDATCPMVKEIHKIARGMEKNGYRIIVIGDKRHDEVLGIIGQLKKKATVIDSIRHIPLGRIRRYGKACVVVQSTHNLDRVLEIIKILRPHIGDLRFFNTICNPTRKRQAEIKRMPLKNDCMVIIGSRTSANTKRLYEISRSLNRKTYWIQSAKEIKKVWFKGAKSVGVASGASTPDSITIEVIRDIKRLYDL